MGKRLLNKLVKYQFILIFFAAGVSFISLSGNWRLYSDPIREIRDEVKKLFGSDPADFQGGAPGDNASDGMDGPALDPAREPGDDFSADTAEDGDPAGSHTEGNAGLVQTPEEETKEFQTVDETYFQDALFIGDSRTVGLRDYGKFEEGPVFYASKGLTIFDLFTEEIVEQEGQRKKITVEEALKQRQFRKIYLMVGINELGTGDVERFEKAYREAVAHIQELQPDAVIYIQSILKVTEERSNRGDYITNEGIIDRNAAIREIADGQKIFYLDVNEAVCDESGCLNPEYSGDGVHITAKYIYVWKDYLMNHAIE